MNNQRGFSLIQILVVVGMIGGLAVVGLQQQDLFKKNKINSDFNTEIVKASEYLTKVLDDPYICTATVNGVVVQNIAGAPAYPGGPKLGDVPVGSAGNVFTIQNAVYRDSSVASDPIFLISGTPHAVQGQEIRPGVKIESIHLLNNGVQDLIRVKFTPRVTNRKAKVGAQVVNKDFFLTSKRGTGANANRIVECNISEQDSDLRAACENVYGTWNQSTKKCFMGDLVDTRTEMIEVWKHTNGTISTQAPLDDAGFKGYASCDCDSKQCSRASMPCRCAVPSCNSVPGCSGGNCRYGASDNADRCENRVLGTCYNWACQYRTQCGLPPPPTGFLIKPRPI